MHSTVWAETPTVFPRLWLYAGQMCHYSLTTACVLPKEVESTDLVGHRKLSQMFHIALSKFLLVLKTTTTTEALISLKIQVSHYSFYPSLPGYTPYWEAVLWWIYLFSVCMTWEAWEKSGDNCNKLLPLCGSQVYQRLNSLRHLTNWEVVLKKNYKIYV